MRTKKAIPAAAPDEDDDDGGVSEKMTIVVPRRTKRELIRRAADRSKSTLVTFPATKLASEILVKAMESA